MTKLIDVNELSQLLNADDADLVVLCAYSSPRPATVGIPGSFVADLEGEFSDHSNPLPHTVPGDVQAVFERFGVGDSTTVVVYDMAGGAFAPRVWRLAKVAGISDVRLLDGGFKAWKAAGLEIAEFAQPAAGSAGSLTGKTRPDLLVDAQTVAGTDRLVVDARSRGRFAGVEDEPRPGMKKGHIPGSANLPFVDVYDRETGKFKDPATLKALFEAEVGDRQDFIFSCGSGVTACVLAAAAELAGYPEQLVYEGSWSEWGAEDADYPVETSSS